MGERGEGGRGSGRKDATRQKERRRKKNKLLSWTEKQRSATMKGRAAREKEVFTQIENECKLNKYTATHERIRYLTLTPLAQLHM